MSRHMAVRYAEPASGAPWDWTCPWCPGGYTSQAVSDAEALAAATSHAILEHGKGTPCVDVYARDGWLAMRYGYCGERACGECNPRGEHPTQDTCPHGPGCPMCAIPDPGYVPDHIRASIQKWSKAI